MGSIFSYYIKSSAMQDLEDYIDNYNSNIYAQYYDLTENKIDNRLVTSNNDILSSFSSK